MSEVWIRRLAVQIAAQLPENPDDAGQVLRFAQEIVETYMRDRAPQAQARVLPFASPGEGDGAASSSCAI